MHLGSDTYAGDVLRRLGVDNVLSDSPERYPKLRLEQLPEVDLVVLPDEPYLFTETDRTRVVSGQALRAGQRPVPNLVWTGDGRGAASATGIAACSAGPIRSRVLVLPS